MVARGDVGIRSGRGFYDWRERDGGSNVQRRANERLQRLLAYLEKDAGRMSRKPGLEKGLTNYGDPEFAAYLRRSFAKSMGYSGEMLERPIIGIATSASGFNNCHRLTPELVEAVKRGVLAAGGLPLEFPTISLGEVFLSPTSLVFRNLMAMDVEEMIRAQPMSAVVLIGGCDKTVPRTVDGRHFRGRSRDPARRRTDDDRALSRRAARRLHRLPPLLGALPLGRSQPKPEIDGGRGQPRGHRGHVRRDGHRQHDGVPRRRRSA